MWAGRTGIHFVFCGYTSPSPSSSFHSSSPSWNKSCSSIRGLLQQASQLIKNLFQDFYKIDYEAVVPCFVNYQGVPLSWVTVNEITVSIYQSKSYVSVVTRDGRVVDEVAVGGVAPDLMLNEDCVRFFDEDEIVLGRLLGDSAFGEVLQGEIPWEYDNGKGEEKERDDEFETTKKVAVKKILLNELLKRGGNQEEILKELYHDSYLSLQVRHPNIMEMVGMCSQTSPPLLLLELLDGVIVPFFLRCPKPNL